MVDKIYTLEEAAEILKISPRTLRGWVLMGKIKAFKMGGRKLIRFHEEDLQAFINQAHRLGQDGRPVDARSARVSAQAIGWLWGIPLSKLAYKRRLT